jgi:hypothetical protein
VDAQKGILRQILYALLVLQALVQESLDRRLIALHDDSERVLIAILVATEKLLVGELRETDFVVAVRSRGERTTSGVAKLRVSPRTGRISSSGRFHVNKGSDNRVP